MTVSDDLDRTFREAAAAAGLIDAAYDLADTPLGTLLVATTERGLCQISFDPDRGLDELSESFGRRVLRVPRRMVSAAEHEVSTCISFGQPVVTMIYDVPARQVDASSRQDVKHFKPSTVPLSA